jgi:hypothetical protein
MMKKISMPVLFILTAAQMIFSDITITYTSRAAVDSKVREKIMLSLKKESRRRFVPVKFADDPAMSGYLCGESEIKFYPCDPDGRPIDTYDFIMDDIERHDMTYVVQELSTISVKYGIDWDFFFDDYPLGSIVKGVPGNALDFTIKTLHARVQSEESAVTETLKTVKDRFIKHENNKTNLLQGTLPVFDNR